MNSPQQISNKKEVNILYTNWKGNTRWRKIIPINIEFKSTSWHKETQWILNALDVEKNEERDFAIKDISKWQVND